MAMNPYAAPNAELEGGAVAAQQQQLADRGTRLGAAMLDGLVAGVVPMIAVVALRGLDGKPSTIALTIAGLWWMAVIGYQMFLLATRSQTMGKKWLGIKIVRADGGPVSATTLFIMRAVVGQGLLGMVPLYGLVDLLFIFRDDRRCVHDLVAGTKVVVG
jgi:uncharacterized RDD family membrane protein YckC